jgi:hypothetical protein
MTKPHTRHDEAVKDAAEKDVGEKDEAAKDEATQDQATKDVAEKDVAEKDAGEKDEHGHGRMGSTHRTRRTRSPSFTKCPHVPHQKLWMRAWNTIETL